MKLLLIFVCLAAQAQTNVVGTWTVKASPNDTAVNINVTQDAATAGPNALFATLAPGTASSTLAASATNTQTTLSLVSATGIQPGMGICLSNPTVNASACTMSANTSMVVSGGEIALVTGACTGTGPYTCPVTRASIGTAAAYSAGQVVTIVRSGSYSQLAANIIKDWYLSVIQNCAYGSQTSVTACAAISSAQATAASNAKLP